MHSAFVFPGQGSQSVSMLAELSERFPQVQQTFSEASEALGYDLWSLVQNGPETELNQTDKTQPAMLAAGIAVWRCWEATSQYKPAYLAGHSLGEYTALVAAKALDFKTAIKLVEKRGQLMQQAVPSGEGAKAVILGLELPVVKAVCQKASDIGVVEAVNFNSPGQVVIAGTKSAVDKAVEIASEKGAKRALLLPVSVPSHCALMRPAAEELLTELESVTLQAPQIPVIHNTSVSTTADPDEIRQLLAQQLYNPVRWVETVEWLAAQGVDTLVECGPGKVLAGLSKRIDKSLQALPVFDSVTLQKTQEALGE